MCQSSDLSDKSDKSDILCPQYRHRAKRSADRPTSAPCAVEVLKHMTGRKPKPSPYKSYKSYRSYFSALSIGTALCALPTKKKPREYTRDFLKIKSTILAGRSTA